MLEVQEYLQNHSLDELSDEYGIEYRKKNGKVSLNYHQIKSPKKEKICKECRGLILRDGSWEVVSYPFDRFFNYGEGEATDIDIGKAIFFEKQDGSIIQCYYDDVMKDHCIGTRKMPEADGMCENLSISFRDLALMAFDKMGKPFDELKKLMYKGVGYYFELETPYNQVCVRHEQMRLVLIGARDLVSLEEIDPAFVNMRLGMPTPKEYRFHSVGSLMSFINDRSPLEHEGVIGRSVKLNGLSFDRVKFKSLAYIEMHGMISNVMASDRNILRLIMIEQIDDVAPVVDDFLKNKIEAIEEGTAKLYREIERDWRELKDIEIQKDFALEAKKRAMPSALFYLRTNRDKNVTVSDFMRHQAENKSSVARLLERIEKCYMKK